jgi:DNA-binding Xre family transcriptional regulator
MITLRIEEILKERGISKTQFADMMGIKKQNVNLLIETNNIRKIEEIANKLGVKFTDLIYDSTSESYSKIMGFIDVNGEIFRIKSKADIEELLKQIE